MKKIVALIPARSGSKGVPHKNIRNLGGLHLIEWSILACKASNLIDRIIVSTDSEEYAGISRNSGAETPFLRPTEISNDHSTDYDFIKHALDWLKANDTPPDYIVHIRPTTPFRDPELIDQAINIFSKDSKATALRSVHPMSESAYKTFEITHEGQLKRIFSENTEIDSANNARQEFPATFIANGYVDVLSTTFIEKNNLIHGNHVLPFITPPTREVDTEEDFSMLELELIKNPNFLARLLK
jgi:CMP-N,N'-diacetyllegionaminic acid synthase